MSAPRYARGAQPDRQARLRAAREVMRHTEPPVRALTQEEATACQIAAIAERFPDCKVWAGRATGLCWAFVPGLEPQLLEAETPRELGRQIAETKGIPWP